MPRPPGIIDRVNYVVHFIEDPCHAPWTVYVETALEAAGEMFLCYATPSPQDVMRFYIKPKSARSRGKFLRDVEEGGEEEESLGLLPDVNELLGTLLPFSDELAASAVHDRIAWFWVLDGILERILWYWFLAEMISEFAFDWTTALNKTEYCSIDRGGSALVQRDTQYMFPSGIVQTVEPMTVRKSWGAVIGTENGTITFEGIPGTIVGGMAITATEGVGEVIVTLYDGTDFEAVQTRTVDMSVNPSIAQSVMFRYQAKPNHTYGFNVLYHRTSIYEMGIYCTNINLNGFGESTQAGTPESI